MNIPTPLPIVMPEGKVWPLHDGTFSISDSGGWLPGTYDSQETATAVLKLGWKAIDALCTGRADTITMADLTPPAP